MNSDHCTPLVVYSDPIYFLFNKMWLEWLVQRKKITHMLVSYFATAANGPANIAGLGSI